MIRSMTAFASAETETRWGALAFELRSVNHRYLELNPRLPEELRAIEPALRERVAAKLTRGKVDVNLRFRAADAGASEIRINDALLDQLERSAVIVGERFPKLSVDFTGLLAWPGLLLREEVDQEGLRQAALDLLDRALDDMLATRQREGERLGAFLRERLTAVERIVADVRTWLPDIRSVLRARLVARLAEVAQAAEPGRLEQELVLQLSRMDIDENSTPVGAHRRGAARAGLPDVVGRRMDFMQEFNRRRTRSVRSRLTSARPGRGRTESADRAGARAGAEYRMTAVGGRDQLNEVAA
jgi:uncharacterized protein (TIGR00255 family)